MTRLLHVRTLFSSISFLHVGYGWLDSGLDASYLVDWIVSRTWVDPLPLPLRLSFLCLPSYQSDTDFVMIKCGAEP